MTTYKCQHCGLVAAMSADSWMYHRLTVAGHTDKYGRILSMKALAELRKGATK
jgi:uncharacterized Zn finger protein